MLMIKIINICDNVRSILNPLIEPWWCKVPKIMREVLHFKFLKTPLNERGGCSTVPSSEPEPESEPEYEPAPEPEGRGWY